VYENPCLENWQGIQCDIDFSENLTHVTELFLKDLNLVGNLPNSVGNLPWLTDLAINFNHLSGTVPATLNKLTDLLVLNFNHNDLTGPLPYLGSLTQLIVFDFYTNQLTGPMPAYLDRYPKLIYVDLYQNHLTGTISESIGTLVDLQYLYFGANHLTGTLPESIGNLKKLSSFYVDCNFLHGTLPSAISTFPDLEYLFLRNNSFSGPIASLFNPHLQVNLSLVIISRNQFTGEIPLDLFRLPSLTVVSAGTNCLYSALPSVMCNSSSLRVLAFDGLHTARACQKRILPWFSAYYPTQSLIGAVPDCIYEMTNLETLHLSSNGVVTKLPGNVILGSRLRDVGLSHNYDVTGPIPAVWQKHHWLNLDLSHTRISGTLHDNFAPVALNQTLSLEDARLSGPLPSTIVHAPTTITVLEGSFFGGNYDGSGMPQNDPYASRYQFGSNSFDVAYFVWLGLNTVPLFRIVCGQWQEWFQKGPLPMELLKRRKMRHLYKICSASKLLMQLAFGLTLLICFPIQLMEVILGVYYSTLTYKYAYTVSLAFVSGKVALAWSMTFLVLFLVVAYFLYLLCCSAHDVRLARFSEVRSQSSESSPERPSIVATIGVVANKTLKFYLYALLGLCDLSVVFGVNCLYVWLMLTKGKLVQWMAPFILSLLKVVWISVRSSAVTYLASALDKHDEKLKQGLMTTYTFVTLVSCILIPCAVVLFISPSCWYNLFVQDENVTSVIHYVECGAFDETGCTAMQEETLETSFPPPFVYSNQCASSILYTYAPAFVYVGIIQLVQFGLRVLVPHLLQWLKEQCRYRSIQCIYWLVDNLTPTILKPVATSDAVNNDSALVVNHADSGIELVRIPQTVALVQPEDEIELGSPARVGEDGVSLSSIVDSRTFLTTLINYLAVLMTYGVVFPPIAVCMFCTMLSHVYFNSREVSAFLIDADLNEKDDLFQRIELDCEGACNHAMLWRAIVVFIIPIASMFYFLFFFDILGDQSSLNAVWLVIAMLLLPACLCAITSYYHDRTTVILVQAQIGPSTRWSEVEMTDVSDVSDVSNPVQDEARV